ncbi:Uu.00g073120.m01.CDS01 [Anthostomella pinea]|uniref:Uu.00g073120.m01.CDS01 n=1 Tax=Anthostomella pinea TaxID=933095 RepID=A0AAI8YLI5_9PEZI|nr:Uu.00g073120.m01.CDS01 [Anthostomella pinea]
MDGSFYSTPPRGRRDLLPRLAKIKTPARTTRSTALYFSDITTSPESETTPQLELEDDLPRRVLRKRKANNTAVTATATAPKRRRREPTVFRKQFGADATEADRLTDHTPRVFPPWSTLPYHVWLRVFHYIAVPIRNVSSRGEDVTEAVGSLLAASRTCRATCEPALANLYKCPPFYQAFFTKSPHATFSQFIQTLSLPPADTIVKYRPKVEILRIDVDAFLSRKYSSGHMTLQRVIQNLPRLSHLELYLQLDQPLSRGLEYNIRWKLSEDDLMQAFEPIPGGDKALGDKTTATQLQSWRWNARLVRDAFSLDRQPEIHQKPSFASIRKVAYVNYQLPSLSLSAKQRGTDEVKERDRQTVADLAASISALPNLQHLILESSTVANGSLLVLLPNTLKHLELINCWEIVSDDVANFLSSHGRFLQTLTVKHCQSLSLGFLTVLGTACPQLTHLDVDLNYFRHHESYADNKPDYDALLEDDQVPTWPATMQSIEINHMRNWSRKAAENFFGSLVDSAPALPHLRRLVFKASIDVAWRQRAELSKQLVEKMTRVFKRKSEAPKDHRTLRPAKVEPKVNGWKHVESSLPVTRRSMRLADQPSALPSLDSTVFTFGTREPRRVSAVGKDFKSLKIGTSIFDADDEDSEDELAAEYFDSPRPKRRLVKSKKPQPSNDEFYHGLCDLVHVYIDNQRPRERQLDMEDFLDSPDGSDSEWDGGDRDVL